MLKRLTSYLEQGVSAFNATEVLKERLKECDYQELWENKDFELKKGGKYFICRNGSSIIAFNIGKKLENPGIMLSASHTDCPSFKLKPNSLLVSKEGVRLNVETYGGPLNNPWLDRPLGICGRIIVDSGDGITSCVYRSSSPFCIIPSVAIHMNREANDGQKLNVQVDLCPLVSLDEKFELNAYLAKELGVAKEAILSYDLYLFPFEKPLIWGPDQEFISAHHLDDLECAATCLEGFLDVFNDDNINIYVSFDNEEVGSLTRQGASSDFFRCTVERIAASLKLDYHQLLANSMMISCDNAHACHPNHPEKADPGNRPYLNRGVVIKYNANQSYTSDALGVALFKKMLSEANIPFQMFTNRSDMRGGSTLGNLLNASVSTLAVDIGLAQLAMHSCYETAGSKDVAYMIAAVKAFYSHHLCLRADGYQLL